MVPKPTVMRVDKPKRRLNAYNFFFSKERQRLLDILPPKQKKGRGHGKIGFFDLAATVSANWKKLSPERKEIYETLAKSDKVRFEREMEEYKATSLYLAELSTEEANKTSAVSKDAESAKAEEATPYCTFVDTETMQNSPSPFTVESMNNASNAKSYPGYAAPTFPNHGITLRDAHRLSAPTFFNQRATKFSTPVPMRAPTTTTSSFQAISGPRTNFEPNSIIGMHFGATRYQMSSMPRLIGSEDLEPTPFAPSSDNISNVGNMFEPFAMEPVPSVEMGSFHLSNNEPMHNSVNQDVFSDTYF